MPLRLAVLAALLAGLYGMSVLHHDLQTLRAAVNDVRQEISAP